MRMTMVAFLRVIWFLIGPMVVSRRERVPDSRRSGDFVFCSPFCVLDWSSFMPEAPLFDASVRPFFEVLLDPEFLRLDRPPEGDFVEAEASLNAKSPARTVEVIPDCELSTVVWTESAFEKIVEIWAATWSMLEIVQFGRVTQFGVLRLSSDLQSGRNEAR